jgi:hypothetical protein
LANFNGFFGDSFFDDGGGAKSIRRLASSEVRGQAPLACLAAIEWDKSDAMTATA